LEERSRRPRRTRTATTPLEHQDLVARLRRANPEYSKYKLAIICQRDYGVTLSASTIGRILRRKALFFTPPVRPKGHPSRAKAARLRKPPTWTTKRPGDLVEVDVKHLPCLGSKRYGFVTINVATRHNCRSCCRLAIRLPGGHCLAEGSSRLGNTEGGLM
jgi:hypothetical protein